MVRSISIDLEILYRFLKVVKENPGINKTDILSRLNNSYHTISGLKDVMVPAGFCKISGANTVSSSIKITQEGEQLLHYIERIIENSE